MEDQAIEPIKDATEDQGEAVPPQVDPQLQELVQVLNLIAPEVQEARKNYPPFHSLHEGYAILQEELDELWDEIKVNPKRRSYDRVRQEAVQVAAMAIRLIIDGKLMDPNHRHIQ